MRALHLAAPLLAFVFACGGAPPDPAAAPAAPPRVDVAKGGPRAPEVATPGALRELAIRVPPGQSLAYRVKTRTEQPGRRVEEEFVLFLDAWGDGTVTAVHKIRNHERSAYENMRGELLPLPQGAQSTYTNERPGSAANDEPAVTERFDRRPAPGGSEEIAFHFEKRRGHAEEVTDGTGTFDVGAMRYDRVQSTRIRKITPPAGGKPVPPQIREVRVDSEIVFDAAASAERTKDRAARREIMLKASQQPAGTANPAADVAAILSGQAQDDLGRLEFYAHGHPDLLWRAALAASRAPETLQRLSMHAPAPDAVLAEVRAAIRKSPNHPVAAMVVSSRDPRLLPEIALIARKSEDPELRDGATEVQKDLKRAATPLATRLRAAKPGTRPPTFEELALDLDPDRDRKALFEYVLAALPSATASERALYLRTLSDMANVELGEQDDAWKQFWSSHQNKTYDEWLYEALASDGAVWTRAHCAERIGERPPSDAARKALRGALEDKASEVRLAAARSLAAMKDDAAIRPLLRALLDDSNRYEALVSLSYFSDSDFGLVSDGAQAPEETAAALGRWLGWAKRRGIDPGFP